MFNLSLNILHNSLSCVSCMTLIGIIYNCWSLKMFDKPFELRSLLYPIRFVLTGTFLLNLWNTVLSLCASRILYTLSFLLSTLCSFLLAMIRHLELHKVPTYIFLYYSEIHINIWWNFLIANSSIWYSVNTNYINSVWLSAMRIYIIFNRTKR